MKGIPVWGGGCSCNRARVAVHIDAGCEVRRVASEHRLKIERLHPSRVLKISHTPRALESMSGRVPFYDWKFHASNKWWTFKKDDGKTNTRFGRFEHQQFITGNPSTHAPPSTATTPDASQVAVPAASGCAQNPIIIDD